MPVVTTKNPTVEEQNNAAMTQPNVLGIAAQGQGSISNTTVPYERPDQLTPIIKPKVQNVQQGNEDVMKAAQQGALDAQGAPNQTMGLVQSAVQKTLQNPLGYDPKQYQQNQLEQYDRNRASSMLAFQQANADFANTGVNKEKAYNFAMQGAQGRSDLENQVTMEQAQKERDAMFAAINAGQDVSKTQSGLDEAAFNRLLNTRAQAEGERSQTQGFQDTVALTNMGYGHDIQMAAINQGYDLAKLDKSFGNEMAKMVAASNLDTQSKTTLMNLQDAIDSKRLMTTQDFSATQANLDRQLATFKANGDWANAEKITNLKAQLDQKAQDAQNDFTMQLTKATQSWQTGERLDTQSYESATNVIDQANKIAIQENDIEAQKYLADQKEKLDLQMQINDMTKEQGMAFINANLAEAKSNGDVQRQMQLIGFQTTQDINKLLAAGEIDKAKAEVKQSYDIALQNNDSINLMALARSKYELENDQRTKDNSFEQQRIDLTKAGVDMAQMEKSYNYLASEVEAGRADPSTLTAFVQKVANKAGVKIVPPDPQATAKAATQKYNDMLNQFALTHPDMVTYQGAIQSNTPITSAMMNEYRKTMPADAIASMKPVVSSEGAKAFNEFFNSTTYGELTTQEKKDKANAGYLGKDDIQSAVAGDKFNFDEPTTISNPRGNDYQVPAGKYTVKETTTSQGTKFFGTKKDTTHLMLIDQNGKEVAEISQETGGAQGNIISNLWAQ